MVSQFVGLSRVHTFIAECIHPFPQWVTPSGLSRNALLHLRLKDILLFTLLGLKVWPSKCKSLDCLHLILACGVK